MSNQYGHGKIVTSGLVLCLDAADINSFRRTGGTWYDLSGQGNHGTYDGAEVNYNDGFVDINEGYGVTTSLSLQTAFTVMGAGRYTDITGRIFTSSNNNWLMGHWANTTENYYSEGWVSSVSAGVSNTAWRIYAATGHIANDSYAMYVNGSLACGPNNAGSQGPNGLGICCATERAGAQVGYLLAYNRVLTQAEILQNYNATKTRFGLT